MTHSPLFKKALILVLLVMTLISTTGTSYTKTNPWSANLAETGSVNLALGKKAVQSSVYKNASAARAVDGNTDGVYKNGSVTHTNSNNQAWWQVDLGKSSNISTIDIWPRTDCCEWRSSNVYVLVSDTPFKSTKLNTARSQRGVSSYFISGSLQIPSTVDVNRTGRYVRIQLSGKDYLSLAEVKVNSVPSAPAKTATPTNVPALPTAAPTNAPTLVPTSIPTSIPTAIPTAVPTRIPTATPTSLPTQAPSSVPTQYPSLIPTEVPPTPTQIQVNTETGPVMTNVATGKLAIQSSVLDGAVALRAVDGNTDGNFNNQSVTHTNEDFRAWWQVDLGANYEIQLMNLWNRSDCCEWRADDVYILVSEKPFVSADLDECIYQDGVKTFHVDGAVGRPSMISINARGQYIRVQLGDKDYLSLAEVEVFSAFPAIVPINTPIPTLAPMNTATPTSIPTSVPTSIPVEPTNEPALEPTVEAPQAEPTPEQPPVVADTSSVSRLAWFYNAPYPENEGLVAEKFNTFYLSIDADYFRDRVKNTGNDSQIVFYFVFNAIFDMGSCDAEPNLSQAAYLPGDFCTISQEHPDWFLLDTNGNRIMEDFGNGKYLVYMDPSNAGWREFWLQRAQRIQEGSGWNGVFMDNMDGGLSRFRRLGQMPANYPDEEALQAAYSDFAAYVANAYFRPNGLKLMANITETSWRDSGWMRYLDNLSGMMEEGFGVDWETGYLSREQWETSMNNYESLQANGKEIIYVAQGDGSDQGRQNFAYASYMLVANGVSTFRYAHYSSYAQPWLYDNYSLVLGSPLGGRYQDGENWVRDFANGKVVVNPDAHTASFEMNQ